MLISDQKWSVERDASNRWWFVTPSGKQVWCLAACCINQGIPTEKWDPNNPGYSAGRLFDSPKAWSEDTQKKLKSWGFNTVGSWSDHKLLQGELYQTPVLHLGSSGIPWKDMWDPAVVKETYRWAEQEISKWKGDPNIIGYFSDNELGWWHGAMFEWAFKAEPGTGMRQRLVELLKKRYATWEAVKKDLDPEGADSFESLEKGGRLFLKPGQNGMEYAGDVLRMQAKRYYELCRDAIHKVDPNALYLGDRYISNFYPEVAQEAGKVCDVVSTNLNANWPDGTFYRFFLDELYRNAKKPIVITEFYECAMENRSGNMNDASGFPTVRTQRERAAGARRQLQEFLSKPYVIGAHWFQFFDEPMHGRDDGENYNMGLLDTSGKPYEELVKIFRAERPIDEKRKTKNELPPIDSMTGGDLSKWPRDLAYVPHNSEGAKGDLYMAWHPQGIFVALAWAEDRWPEAFYRNGILHSEDRAKLTLTFEGIRKPIEATIGLGGEMDISGANKVFDKPWIQSIAIFRVPANAFGRAQLKAGEKVSFKGDFSTFGRAYRMSWKGDFILQGAKN